MGDTDMVVAVIQARMGSQRLPGKSMMPLCGVPLIEHIVERVREAKLVDSVIVATTDSTDYDALADHARKFGVNVFRGPEHDVLARFFYAAQMWGGADAVVRITADDPFKDPQLIDEAVGFWNEHGEWDYVELGGSTWPTGLGVEVFSAEALGYAHRRAVDPDDREHVTPFIRREMRAFELQDAQQRRTSETRWTIDTPEDLAFARGVYEKLYPTNPIFGYKELLEAGY